MPEHIGNKRKRIDDEDDKISTKHRKMEKIDNIHKVDEDNIVPNPRTFWDKLKMHSENAFFHDDSNTSQELLNEWPEEEWFEYEDENEAKKDCIRKTCQLMKACLPITIYYKSPWDNTHVAIGKIISFRPSKQLTKPKYSLGIKTINFIQENISGMITLGSIVKFVRDSLYHEKKGKRVNTWSMCKYKTFGGSFKRLDELFTSHQKHFNALPTALHEIRKSSISGKYVLLNVNRDLLPL